MRYNYTEEDIEFLKIYYPRGDWEEIKKRFPTLTKSGIHHKCSRMGIKGSEDKNKGFHPYSRWTKDESDILRKTYSTSTKEDIIKLFPNRKWGSIVMKANSLGLKSLHDNNIKWKDEELKYIKDNWELTPDYLIAKELNRTQRSVKWKREELGLYRIEPGSIASYENITQYIRGNIQDWKKASMCNCNYKCVLTGSKDFAIHHLYGVSNMLQKILTEYPKYRGKDFNELSKEDLSFILSKFKEEQAKYPLGECVRKDLHVMFHSLYGQYYNTPEQWERFKEDYAKGAYKDYILIK